MRVVAHAVGVAFDADLHTGIGLHDVPDLVEDGVALGQEPVAVRLEADGLEGRDERALDADAVGAAVVVGDAVGGFGLVGAGVLVVVEAVLVVVLIGAAVFVLEAVEVLGIVGAFVDAASCMRRRISI